ncbi:hypothetical protein LIER_06321 [Lithospermum erythrorhizon]|uniref:Uncharacterized protein n=1 Tax=Lithospermum erythrorhizon TaxID=34254 RepID=A0AAV3P3V6_LITER
MAEINPTLPLFFNMHNTLHFGPLTSFPSAKDCKIFVEFKPEKIDEGRWHTKWWYMRGGMSDAVPKKWTSLAEALCPNFKKTALVHDQIATLKWLFVNPYYYKIFCEEGILIQEGLIRSKEFDQTVANPVSWGIPTFTSIYYRLFSLSDLTFAFSQIRY